MLLPGMDGTGILVCELAAHVLTDVAHEIVAVLGAVRLPGFIGNSPSSKLKLNLRPSDESAAAPVGPRAFGAELSGGARFSRTTNTCAPSQLRLTLRASECFPFR